MNDYAMKIAADTVRVMRDLPGSLDQVWSYLVESDKRGKWLAVGELEPRAGGSFTFTWFNSKLSAHNEEPPEEYRGAHSMTGRVLEWEPPHRLRISWGERDSEVLFELEPNGTGTRLVLTHERLADRSQMLGVSGGWHAHLDILVDRLNGVEPRPFWSNHARLRDHYEKTL